MHSEVQKEILCLYRQILRCARYKPQPIRESVEKYAKEEFHKNVLLYF